MFLNYCVIVVQFENGIIMLEHVAVLYEIPWNNIVALTM
jgi:hypothetical protein